MSNLSGEYFAGKDYNQNSGIVSGGKTTLQSASTITINDVKIHPGANYSFVAQNSITFNSASTPFK